MTEVATTRNLSGGAGYDEWEEQEQRRQRQRETLTKAVWRVRHALEDCRAAVTEGAGTTAESRAALLAELEAEKERLVEQIDDVVSPNRAAIIFRYLSEQEPGSELYQRRQRYEELMGQVGEINQRIWKYRWGCLSGAAQEGAAEKLAAAEAALAAAEAALAAAEAAAEREE